MRSYKGWRTVLGVKIMMPGKGKGKTAYEKLRDRARFRQWAAIEPVIVHLKNDYRMLRNYLKGVEDDSGLSPAASKLASLLYHSIFFVKKHFLPVSRCTCESLLQPERAIEWRKCHIKFMKSSDISQVPKKHFFLISKEWRNFKKPYKFL